MRDPVCGMTLHPEQAAATSVHAQQTYYFCAPACKQRFDQDPERYLHPGQQLSHYASTLYAAWGALSTVFHGPQSRAGMQGDLTGAEWDALRLLGRQGLCNMRQLAAGCGAALSTMTGIIDRLVKKGLVQRRHSQTDRRVVLIRLTDPGKQTYEARLDADMRLVLTMLQALSADEQGRLVEMVQKIVQALPEHSVKAYPGKERPS